MKKTLILVFGSIICSIIATTAISAPTFAYQPPVFKGHPTYIEGSKIKNIKYCVPFSRADSDYTVYEDNKKKKKTKINLYDEIKSAVKAWNSTKVYKNNKLK